VVAGGEASPVLVDDLGDDRFDRIATERPDCTMFARFAARVKCCSSAAAMKSSICRMSMPLEVDSDLF